MDIKISKLLLSKYNSLNDIKIQFMNTKENIKFFHSLSLCLANELNVSFLSTF
jgi:hypothetical protein